MSEFSTLVNEANADPLMWVLTSLNAKSKWQLSWGTLGGNAVRVTERDVYSVQCEEELRDVTVAVWAGVVQRRLAVVVLQVDVQAGIAGQNPHNLQAAPVGGPVDQAETVLVPVLPDVVLRQGTLNSGLARIVFVQTTNLDTRRVFQKVFHSVQIGIQLYDV